MTISNVDCWKLIVQSKLLSADQCQKLSAQYGRAHGEGPSDASVLVRWLISQRAITEYHGKVLLSGQPGPFLFGDYKVSERLSDGRLAGSFRARHVPTNHTVMLRFVSGRSVSADSWSRAKDGVDKLGHAHLVRHFAAVECERKRFFVHENLAGNSLGAWQESRGPAGTSDACRLAVAVAQAIQHLHRADLAHNNVRTENIWLENNGNVKLLIDLESVVARPSLDQRQADIRGLAHVLYALATGSKPLIVATEDLAQQLSPQLRGVMERMLSENGGFESIDDALEELSQLVDPGAPSIELAPPLPTLTSYLAWLESRTPPNAQRPLPLKVAPRRSSQRVAATRQTSRRGPLVPIATVGATLLVALIVLWLGRMSPTRNVVPSPPEDRETLASPSSPPTVSKPQSLPLGSTFDDGVSLWASPTNGPPLSTGYLPPGGQLFLFVRLAEILQDVEGQQVLKSLGPKFDRAYATWLAAVGVDPLEIEQLSVALYPQDSATPSACFVVHLRNAMSDNQLLEAWRISTGELVNDDSVYSGDSWSYFIPEGVGGKLFVMGRGLPKAQLAAGTAAGAALRRELGQLVARSDSERHLQIHFAPNFLLQDSVPLLETSPKVLRDFLESFLGESLKAGALSMHFSPNLFFIEAAFVPDVATSRRELADRYRERLSVLSNQAKNRFAEHRPHPYWQAIAERYPVMLQFLQRQTRIRAEGRVVLMNSALPRPATHNLAFGTAMMLSSVGTDSGERPSLTTPRLVKEALRAKISVSFEQESLEMAMGEVALDYAAQHGGAGFQLKIVILGEDLELEGVTRNQQIRNFSQREKTLAEVLTALVLKANPVPAASPADPTQKVVWVAGPNPSEGTILITTRKAAQEKYSLPRVFRSE